MYNTFPNNHLALAKVLGGYFTYEMKFVIYKRFNSEYNDSIAHKMEMSIQK